ncbi:MAG: hypothetical protein ACI9N3_003116 [Colwellia sp.]|jgi:hypothetical protein
MDILMLNNDPSALFGYNYRKIVDFLLMNNTLYFNRKRSQKIYVTDIQYINPSEGSFYPN